MSAIIVTRGDVDCKLVAASLPQEWEVLVWNNELTTCFRWGPDGSFAMFPFAADLSVYGRYAAIEYASHELIYVQDDDCLVTDPQALADHYATVMWHTDGVTMDDGIVANMPERYRPNYDDSCLVGFGSCFHRNAPRRAFQRMLDHFARQPNGPRAPVGEFFYRECDTIFSTLTPFVLLDVGKEDLPYASDANRLWKQPDHFHQRQRMLKIARGVRDA